MFQPIFPSAGKFSTAMWKRGGAFHGTGATSFCHSRMAISAAMPGGSAHTPWGNFLLVQKVTKNTLRGFAPKNPGFLEQGRGAFSLADRIGRAITYGPRHFPVVRLPAASAQVMHRLFPPAGENALAPLCHLRAKRRRFATVALRNARLRAGVLSPPDPLRWAPAGAPSR